jgi:hypothetical protein
MHRARDARTVLKTTVLVNNFSSYGHRHAAWNAGLFYCEFWRSRRRHIWARLPPSYYGLRRSTDVQAMLSPYRIAFDINRQNPCDELPSPSATPQGLSCSIHRAAPQPFHRAI